MRWVCTTVSLVVALAWGQTAAAPGDDPPPQPAPPPLSQVEAQNYAVQVFQAINVISDQYYRPVAKERLGAAALLGLYEAAGLPVPERFGDLDKALEGKDVMAELARVRKEIGNLPALRGDDGVRISLQSLTQALDPHSLYLPMSEYQRSVTNAGYQNSVGLLLEDKVGAGPLVVRYVALDGPAQKAGVRPGDQILEINSQPTQALTLAQGLEKLNGEPATVVSVAVKHADEQETKTVKLTRAVFQESTVLGVTRREDKSWDYMLDAKAKIGFIRLTAIGHNTPVELQKALVGLQEAGMRGLILDLRDCPGGLLSQGTAIANLFVDKEVMVTIQGRNDRQIAPGLQKTASFTAFPLVILIGPDTSGGGELIAAYLQDQKRAEVAGQRSRGKASVQNILSPGNHPGAFSGNHAFRLTTGIIVRPSGKNLQRMPDSKRTDDWGVLPEPGLEVRLSPDFRRKIREWRLLHDLRPADSRNALPLDDPEADPVQFKALGHLYKTLQ